MNINSNYQSNYNSTKFKALKSIRFNGEYKNNFNAQSILLDIFEKNETIKTFCEKFDTNVVFDSRSKGIHYDPIMYVEYTNVDTKKDKSIFDKFKDLFKSRKSIRIEQFGDYQFDIVESAKSLQKDSFISYNKSFFERELDYLDKHSPEKQQAIRDKINKLIPKRH